MNRDHAQQILSFLVQRGKDGAPRFAVDDVKHAIPAIAFELLRSAPDSEVPRSVEVVLQAWLAERGLGADASSQEVQRALVQTYEERPIAPELKLGLAELLRSLGGDDGDFRRFLDEGASAYKPIEDTPPPAGAVKANPLARFVLEVPPKK